MNWIDNPILIIADHPGRYWVIIPRRHWKEISEPWFYIVSKSEIVYRSRFFPREFAQPDFLNGGPLYNFGTLTLNYTNKVIKIKVNDYLNIIKLQQHTHLRLSDN